MKFLNICFFSFVLFIRTVAQDVYVRHNIDVRLTPEKSALSAIDTIFVPKIKGKKIWRFKLNSDLQITATSEGVKIRKIKSGEKAGDVGMDRDITDETARAKADEYEATFTKRPESFWLKYEGKIYYPVESNAEEYQRGFGQTAGIISSEGVYLAGSSYWLPSFDERLVVFRLKTVLPPLWKTVSQGKRISERSYKDKHVDEWRANKPQEEVFLIAAKFHEYASEFMGTKIFAFLRTPDEALANKYIETTGQYLQMYEGLLGKYPYSKFALVENFWETGYGMPSFTLLGPKIIRFPFILHSSYPHELLHNWWGNSVYVDFSKGNWCEGITAYMADHLIKEQRGQGVEYRRATLQKFTDFVNEKNDFPLRKFIARYDAPSEAIGYGKALMMWHMLRQLVGDKNFVESFKLFYERNKFRRASFEDIRHAVEEKSGKALSWFFEQWVNRVGAPELKLEKIIISKDNTDYTVEFTLAQIQKDKPFKLHVPVLIETVNGLKNENCFLDKRKKKFKIRLDSEPLEILVDPQFDVFRKLNPLETPPALTKAYGSAESVIILPQKSDRNYDNYLKFAELWTKTHSEKIEIKTQNDLSNLPANKAVWVLGYKNKFLKEVNKILSKRNGFVANDSVKLDEHTYGVNDKDFVVTLRNPHNIRQVIVWASIANIKAVEGLVRKLPHYGKYSYLVFEGNEPTNIGKGEWTVLNSPMVKKLSSSFNGKINLPERKALAYVKPVFSAERMFAHIKFLASKQLKGRGLGTPELDKAADYIARKFEEYGLKPGGDGKSYFQTWTQSVEGKNTPIVMRNVIGIIPGRDPLLAKEAVVVSAHYDHLGLGWPDVHKGDEGKIHPGADDNASGIAVLLELAHSLGRSFKPSRTIVFVAFTGEEAGLLGSKHFVAKYERFPKDKIFADLNLDTVGRLFGKKLLILNANTAREWKYIFMGASYTTGVPTETIRQQLDASDQVSFINAGIPAVQIFSGPHPDYHRPTDTPEKIDKNGLVKVASVTKEVLEYLTERKEPLSFAGIHKGKTKRHGKIRRVSTGTVPDFTYSGKGVRVSEVEENSPAQRAGIRKGDVLTGFNGKAIENLRDFSEFLKACKPGDVVKIRIKRNGKELEVKVKLGER
jgi:hypothetical protein